MKHLLTVLIATVGVIVFAPLVAEETTSTQITAAINDPLRAADKPNDARRHLAEVIAFSQVKPGDTVVELIPSGGYFTRVLSRIVGPKGHIYALWPTEYLVEERSKVEEMRAMAKKPEYNNIEVIVQPAAEFKVPKLIDVMFTSQNYHDYPDKFMGRVDPVAFGKQVFAATKNGGVFIVIDHVAEPGSGLRDTDTLHRIDPAKARQLVEAAGFKFDGESNVLRNPEDDHKRKVFDPAIRGHTDQFMYRFRKVQM